MKKILLVILNLIPLIFLAQHSVFTAEKMEKMFTLPPGSVERKVVSYIKNSTDSSYFVSVTRAERLEKALYISPECTPNGDGVNDQITLPSNKDAVQKLLIFDNAGQLLFYSSSPDQGWTGTGLKTGMYVYYLEVKLKGGEKIIQKGNIALK